MKLEDFLMQTQEEHRRRSELEEEVAELHQVLEKEKTLNGVLRCALRGPLVSRCTLSPILPLQVQVLLAELAMVEEEIVYLEGKMKDLKLWLREEGKRTEALKLHHEERWLRRRRGRFFRRFSRSRGFEDALHKLPEINSKNIRRRGRLIKGTTLPFKSIISDNSQSDSESSIQTPGRSFSEEEETSEKTPNELSEELVQCLISIFHKLNQTSGRGNVDPSNFLPKLTLSCMSSKGSTSKSNISCKTPAFSSDESNPALNPHGLLPGIDGTVGERGPYKNFISITKNSLDMGCMSHCFFRIGDLRGLIHRLRKVDVSSLNNKQKLAFWINIYNACIMNVFLQHGLPSSSEKVLELLNKAALNVGGIVLNALAIEHFILRHHTNTKLGIRGSKESLLQHSYGLSYPEPNITFALCRGTWSSPALRIYTAENVVDELERAKTEYLEAAVQVTSRRRIILPKLLSWHMSDFADDVDSLVEWVYSQLPRSTPLKRRIMECLKRDRLRKMVEIQPYDPEFRYLLPFPDLP
ncbi:uncharacterized protein LOC144715874 isoform X2 [Wolffia australiana]